MSSQRDLTGVRFGRLIVLEKADWLIEKNGKRRSQWRVRCDCGNITVIREANLIIGATKSCGCLSKEMTSFRNSSHLEGKKFHRLLVLKLSHKKDYKSYWFCQCDCGNTTVVLASNLTRDHTRSCGCYKMERIIQTKTTHG